MKGLPSGAVWDYYGLKQGVPVGMAFFDNVAATEQAVLANRR